MKPTCEVCGQPVGDQARLCRRCSDLLARDLGDVPALVDELEVSRTRQSRGARDGSGLINRSEDRPLPWDERASEASAVLRSTLVAWVRVVCEERGVRPPVDDLAAMSGFLLRHHEWLRHHVSAAKCADDVGVAVRFCRVRIDRRPKPDLTWIGPCRVEHDGCEDDDRGAFCCVVEVYAALDATRVLCAVCGAEHEVASRQAWLLDEARDQLATAAVIAPALSRLGWNLSDSTIRSWVGRSRLVAHGLDHRGNQMFRVGDVLDLLQAEALRQAGLAAKREAAKAIDAQRRAC